MNLRLAGSCLLVLSTVVAAADNPFIGQWKLNPSKSDFSGETEKYEDAGGGKIRLTSGALSFTFTTDGKEHAGMFAGDLVSVKQIDPKTWEETIHRKGKVLETITSTLSDDGNTLTEVVKGTRPDGSSFENTTTNTRVGSGSGLLGTWKSKGEQQSSPATIEFAANGADGIAFILPNSKARAELKFDGKDYPAKGPTVPSGLTLAVTKTGDRSFDLIQKVKGKPIFKATYTVSDDGKTITRTGGSVGTNAQTKAVYDKQ
jgi:hypothetical protein